MNKYKYLLFLTDTFLLCYLANLFASATLTFSILAVNLLYSDNNSYYYTSMFVYLTVLFSVFIFCFYIFNKKQYLKAFVITLLFIMICYFLNKVNIYNLGNSFISVLIYSFFTMAVFSFKYYFYKWLFKNETILFYQKSYSLKEIYYTDNTYIKEIKEYKLKNYFLSLSIYSVNEQSVNYISYTEHSPFYQFKKFVNFWKNILQKKNSVD